MSNTKNFWSGEAVSDTTDSNSSVIIGEQKEFNWWWIFAGVLLVGLIIFAVVLNINHQHTAEQAATTNIDIDNGDTKIDWTRYSTYDVELAESLNIASSGTYHLTGALADGMVSVKINGDAVVRLILDNVSIKNSAGPAIACYGGDDLVIELVGENYLEDGASYDGFDEDVNGVIYSKADLTLTGTGSLDIKANYQDGIVGKDDLKINGGIYDIVAADDGIRGKDSVYIVDGEISLNTKGDAIKSTNDINVTKGFVLVTGGEIEIMAGDDGIHAYNKLIVDGGAIHIIKSYEGLEAQQITINDGEITVFSNDDGINAGNGSSNTTGGKIGAFSVDENCIVAINGGSVYVNAAGDGIDSNGYLYINGGSVLVDGPTNNGNGALDASGGIIMNGGSVLAVGASSMAESLGADSKVYSASIYFDSTQSKDTLIEIRNADGETIISHTAAKAFSHMAVGTTDFELNGTYYIYLNDTLYESFTITDIVTAVGNGGMMGPGGQPGGQNNGQPGASQGNTQQGGQPNTQQGGQKR